MSEGFMANENGKGAGELSSDGDGVRWDEVRLRLDEKIEEHQ
jgi:hypothetical protein